MSLRFIRHERFVISITLNNSLTQNLSCRAVPRHLQSTVEDSDELHFFPSMGLGIEMTKLRSA